MSIYTKIQAVMQDVQYLKQDDTISTGSTGGSYKAITEEKVTSIVRAAMVKHGLVLFPTSMVRTMDRYEVVRASSGKTGIDYISAVDVMYTLADTDTGESVAIASSGTGIDTGDKAIGKAMTYAYKYALLRTFAIPTGEDPDKVASQDNAPAIAKTQAKTTSADAKPAESNTSAPTDIITKAQKDALVLMCVNDQQIASLTDIRKRFGYARTSLIKVADLAEITAELKAEIEDLEADVHD